MSEPALYAISVKANCGCRWSKVTVNTSCAPETIAQVFSETGIAVAQHGAVTGHVVEIASIIRPTNVERKLS